MFEDFVAILLFVQKPPSSSKAEDCELTSVQAVPVTEAGRWAGQCLGSATPPPAQDTPITPPTTSQRPGAGACPGGGSCSWTGWGEAGPPPSPLPRRGRLVWRSEIVALSLSLLSLYLSPHSSSNVHSLNLANFYTFQDNFKDNSIKSKQTESCKISKVDCKV